MDYQTTTSSQGRIELDWIVLPKGIRRGPNSRKANGRLHFTVMALFRQKTFDPHVKIEGKTWTAWVKKNLQGFELSLSTTPTPVTVLLTENDRNRLQTGLWELFFKGCGIAKASGAWEKAVTRAIEPIRDCTANTAWIMHDMAMNIIALHLSDSNKIWVGSAIAGTKPMRVQDMFRAPVKEAAALDAGVNSWKNQVREGYHQLASFYLPPKPSFKQRFDAERARFSSKGLSKNEVFIKELIGEMNAHPDASPTTLSAEAVTTLRERLASKCTDDFIVARPKPVIPNAAPSFTHKWACAMADHVIGTKAYSPDKDAVAHNSSEIFDHPDNSMQNRLAMLMSEPGLLGPLGLVFDLEMDVEDLSDDTRIAATAKWAERSDIINDNESPQRHTVMTSYGLAKPSNRDSIFDSKGYLKLGQHDGKGEPLFMLSDFCFDEGFRKYQIAAQADRNQLPEISPGSSLNEMPFFEFPDIKSDDLTLHWKGRHSAEAKSQEPRSDLNIYLDDLVIGIRPYWGQVSTSHGNRITWLALTAKRVEYDVLDGESRDPRDIAKDFSIVNLISRDKRSGETDSVSDTLFKYSGWGLGVPLPGSEVYTNRLLKKRELFFPKSYPPHRIGNTVCLAAALVLRDGSSTTPQNVDDDLGSIWDERAKELIVGSHEGNYPKDPWKPFKLLRWERLKAPVVLHDKPPPHGWWPTETATRIVLASSAERGFGSHHRSSRFVVPDKEPDPYMVWKHGKFDVVPPSASAFPDIAMDANADFIRISDSGEPTFRRSWRAPFNPVRRVPYHPDPLVTHLGVWLVRRVRPGSDQWVPICDNNLQPVWAEFSFYAGTKWPYAHALKVECVACARDKMPSVPMKLTKNELTVFVPEGETFSLLLTPASDNHGTSKMGFGKDRVIKHVTSFAGGKSVTRDSVAALTESLAPFISNSKLLDIVHVSQRPIIRPCCTITLGDRLENESGQRLAADLSFDPGSTGSLELYASWREVEGRLAALLQGAPVSVEIAKLVEKFNPDDFHSVIDLEDKECTEPVRHPVTYKALCLQEFNDFKHRKVAYWSRAIGAVALNNSDDTALPSIADGQEKALMETEGDIDVSHPRVKHILASKAPPPPQIRYLVPAFRFDSESSKHHIRRTRKGVLALHLDGDWFASGEDEQLAIVLLAPTAGDYNSIRDACDEIASFWGADPIRQSDQSLSRLPDLLKPEYFAGNVLRMDDYKLSYKGNEFTTSLLLFNPVVCKEASSWRVEIPLENPSGVSRPFVRFAFARYQPFALSGLHLSDVVVADYIQLSDRREVVIYCDPQSSRLLDVTVYGSYSEGQEEAARFRMKAWLERRCSGLLDGGQSAWLRDEESTSVELVRAIRDGRACWHCRIETPESKSAHHYRVALLEVEEYSVGDGTSKRGERPIYFDLIPMKELG